METHQQVWQDRFPSDFRRPEDVTHLYRFIVSVRDNRDDKFGEANANYGEVLEVRHLNPFIIDISPIYGIEIVKPNAVRSDCHGAVQWTYFGIINLHVCPAAITANGVRLYDLDSVN